MIEENSTSSSALDLQEKKERRREKLLAIANTDEYSLQHSHVGPLKRKKLRAVANSDEFSAHRR
jgi:hypothetical protein